MIFEFDQQPMFMQSITIADIGNTALRCTTSDCMDFFIIITTVFGKTSITKFGPVFPDTCNIFEEYSLTYNKIDYKESKIITEISKFLNTPKHKIKEVTEISVTEALSCLPAASCFTDL